MTVLTKFGESLGGKLAERWLTVSGTAPFAFAAAGLAAWLVNHGPDAGWRRLQAFVAGLSAPLLVVLVVVGVLALGAAGAVVAQLATPALRLLEGYWPRPLHPMASGLVNRACKRRAEAVETIRSLGPAVNTGNATSAQVQQVARAEAVRRRIPSDRVLVQPTGLGNLLRAAESRSWERYGLDAVVTWPSLWLVLPDSARAELAEARSRVDRAVVGLVWCLLVAVWAVWTVWAVPAAALAAAAALQWWVRPAVSSFGDLVEAAFHTHRFALYAALRLPPPSNAGEEQGRGRTVTEYLRRGSDDTKLTFTHPSSP